MLSSYDLVILVGSLLILATAAFAFYRMAMQVKKRREGDAEYSIGDYINDTLLREQSTFVVFVLFMINIAEGILSASIHPPHETQINPIARFFTHISVALVGILAAVNFAKLCINFLSHSLFVTERITRNKPWNWIKLLIQGLLVYVVGYLAVKLPYWNLSIIATGLGQMNLAEMAFYNTFSFSGSVDFTQYGYDPDFNPFADMSFQMRASWILVLCHYALAIYDSLLAANTYVNTKIAPGSIDSKMKDRKIPKEEIESLKEDATTAFEEILDWLNYTGKAAKVESLVKAFSKIDRAKRNKIVSSLAGLRNKVINFDKEADKLNNATQIKAKRTLLTDQIFDFFARSVAQGGMSQPLSRGSVEEVEDEDAAEE